MFFSHSLLASFKLEFAMVFILIACGYVFLSTRAQNLDCIVAKQNIECLCWSSFVEESCVVTLRERCPGTSHRNKEKLIAGCLVQREQATVLHAVCSC